MGMGCTGLRGANCGDERAAVICGDRIRRWMRDAFWRSSIIGRAEKSTTFGMRWTNFGLPEVMETTLGYFGMPEHRLMRKAESQSKSKLVWKPGRFPARSVGQERAR